MNNPFTSKQFTNIWLKHFNDSKASEAFECLHGVQFIKQGFLSTYVNVGMNLTKGISYTVNKDTLDYKGKTFLIYDVPSYFNVETLDNASDFKLKKVFQYHGFLMNLDGLESAQDYINSRFSSKNRREFRSNKRRLETCFNISYKFIYGSFDGVDFDLLFKQFHALLSNRFSEKQTDYHHLDSHKWSYYTELVHHMILEKKASLLVIYKDDTPIGITLNFHADHILFETITVFDPDYYKFSIGKTSIIKLLEWCFENNVTISDFSKGDFDYKHKWSNLVYDFDYHILYDSKSLKARIKASLLERYFKLKLYLRERKLNDTYRKFLYYFNRSNTRNTTSSNFKIEKIEGFAPSDSCKLIDYSKPEYAHLKKFIYTFLFANTEPEADVSVYKETSKDIFMISGSKNTQKVSFL